MDKLIAKIAVSAATYGIDRPYDYLVPRELMEKLAPGMRVSVPFSRGNRITEGVVLALSSEADYDKLKSIATVLDEKPVLSEELIKLALWMHERFFCTVYDAVRAMLPAGLWYDSSGSRRVKDKTVSYASLLIPAEDAVLLAGTKRRSAPSQATVLELLSGFGGATVNDIRYLTGASSATVKRLEKDGLISIEAMEVYRRPVYRVGEKMELPPLNLAQQEAFEGIFSLTKSGKAGAALLYGVTGSGKTQVYVHLIDELLKKGLSSIMLVPEISLTPQMLETFSSYFGENIAVLHSSLSAGERYDEWKRVKNGEARVVIGTRSAVFAPVENLGLIIIDEEQEDSYKSENSPRYHARDVAKFRCAHAGATLLLGSATPDIETRYHAQTGRYAFFSLPERFNTMRLPVVEIVDMKKELRAGNGGNLSRLLVDELSRNIKSGQQSILFLNRRGASKLISCSECGYTYKCPRCSVHLTYHSANKRLMCHYCGHSQHVDSRCPQCGGELCYIGAGTQKIEEELLSLFPETPTIRMDADTVGGTGSHDLILSRFREENIPIMIGTQMVTKGLDFPNVTLVGVVLADQGLYCSDYRSAERTFSLLTQVIGRCGRGELPGRAVIQTFTPDNQVITQAAQQDYDSFFSSELEMRRLQWCPPFSGIFAITATGPEEGRVIRCLNEVRGIVSRELRSRGDVRVLGPAPLPVAKVNNRFRYRLNIACQDGREVRELISGIINYYSSNKDYRDVLLFGDIDPRQ